MNIRVRSISHEIILHSHLSRNPLDSKVKSYCKTTHIEAAITSHLFEGKMHCWSKPPHVRNPVYKASHISCTSNFQLLPAASNCFKKIHMSSRRIVGYVQVSRDTAHPKVQAKLILNLQTCFQYGFAVDTAGLTSDERITNSIQCQCKQQVELHLSAGHTTHGWSRKLRRTPARRSQFFLMSH